MEWIKVNKKVKALREEGNNFGLDEINLGVGVKYEEFDEDPNVYVEGWGSGLKIMWNKGEGEAVTEEDVKQIVNKIKPFFSKLDSDLRSTMESLGYTKETY